MGNLLRSIQAPGQESAISQAKALTFNLDAANVIADEAYDTNGLRAEGDVRGIGAVIPAKSTRVIPIPHDQDSIRNAT